MSYGPPSGLTDRATVLVPLPEIWTGPKLETQDYPQNSPRVAPISLPTTRSEVDTRGGLAIGSPVSFPGGTVSNGPAVADLFFFVCMYVKTHKRPSGPMIGPVVPPTHFPDPPSSNHL